MFPGSGGTKRVVVWDTAIQHLTEEEILFVFGHELGHYVLGHVLRRHPIFLRRAFSPFCSLPFAC